MSNPARIRPSPAKGRFAPRFRQTAATLMTRNLRYFPGFSTTRMVGLWIRPVSGQVRPASSRGTAGTPGRRSAHDEERRFLLRTVLDRAYFQLCLPAEPQGHWLPTPGDPPPGPPAELLPEWLSGSPSPANWPSHIHPPRGCRPGFHRVATQSFRTHSRELRVLPGTGRIGQSRRYLSRPRPPHCR